MPASDAPRFKLLLQPSGRHIEGTKGQALLTILRENDSPIGSSCGGNLVCGHCHLTILEGAENLSPPDSEELRLLQKKEAGPRERMACSARIFGPVTLQAGYW